MKRHLAYLKYVLRHKWFVFRASLFTPNYSLWKALTHDMSKFLPDEWFPYARTFYTRDGKSRYKPDKAFNLAWLKHQHRNEHHWQHWVLRGDDDPETALAMSPKALAEMVADWAGAGKAITGRWEIADWFEGSRGKMRLEPLTEGKTAALVNFLDSSLKNKED